MKRLITLFAAVAFAGQAWAEIFDFSAVCGTGQTLYYKITSNTEPYTVAVTYPNKGETDCYTGYERPQGELSIPLEVENDGVKYNVISISDYAFYGCRGLTSVTIPNSVTSIGDNAFEYCSSLASVTIGNSVTYIGKSAFSDCISLASIVIAEENTKYDSRNNSNAIIETETNTLVFGCKNTKIPNTITTIGWFAFYHCKDLTSVTIPNSVTYIGGSAFVDCSSLTSVTIPNTVTYIGNQAFASCTNATIYCEEEGEPDEWDWAWNDGGVKVVWGSEMPTAVTETAATAVNIYAYGRSIVVENATDEISVYNVMGTLVCRDVARNVSTVAESGIRAELQVNGTGVYIVRVGNIAKRVVIN